MMNKPDRSRRQFLHQSGLVAAAGATVFTAGCMGSVDRLGKSQLRIIRVDSAVIAPGKDKLTAHVKNSWITNASATLVGKISFQNGGTYRKDRVITVASGATDTYSFVFDVSRDDPTWGEKGDRPSMWLE